MKRSSLRCALLALVVAALIPTVALGQQWKVVVNNGDVVPGDSRSFNSYNPPSVNVTDLVVFRGRSKGGMSGQPAHGIYIRDMRSELPAVSVFDRNTEVPFPNNLASTFIEPPSFPRIDIWGDTLASRGVHSPVWQYFIPPDIDTRAGTTGIYTVLNGSLRTGASNLGQVPAFEFLSVPGYPGTKFDVFPGAAAVTGDTIVFKGNYVVGLESHTGVYYRTLEESPLGGVSSPVLIANNEVTEIPGTGGTVFGSTAPPSAAVSSRASNQARVVFAGFDNEENPTAGGIYLADLGEPSPPLKPLVEIGSRVPGEKLGVVFNRLGEGVSFDGRFVAFWGAWGSDEKKLVLQCPEDGNADRIAFCLEQYPDGFETSVPVHQGIFVHDIRTGRTRAVAKTPGDFDDFVFWNFSGRVPGTGEGDDDGELARWRSSAFVAVSGLVDGRLGDANYHVAFKARTGLVDPETDAYLDPIDGIYLRKGPRVSPIRTLAETGMDGTRFDPEAVDPETQMPLPVTEMGIERDGFRGKTIVITVTMGTEEAGWAGIYLKKIR